MWSWEVEPSIRATKFDSIDNMCQFRTLVNRMDHLFEDKYSSYLVHVCGGSQISWCKSDMNSIHAAQWMSDLGEMRHTNRIKICDKVSVRMITHMAMQLHAMHYQCCLACSGHHWHELVICCLFVAIHKIVRESYVIQCCAFCDMCWSEQAARVQHFLFAHCLQALYLMSLVHLFDLSMSIWIGVWGACAWWVFNQSWICVQEYVQMTALHMC